MEHEKKSSFGDFVTGIVVGGTIGYVIALLSAPRPGLETREILAERGREASTMARDRVQTVVDKTGKLVTEGRERLSTTLEETANRSRERAEEVKERGNTLIYGAREQASETMRKVADQVDPNHPNTTDTGPAI